MSVIIRLQNLPWSANALDIRSFFRGLSIPDGGVHIVGGEMGDAFIAFSTDEDARQAMLLDRGKINEVQIRLLLSSRAEMQKVIESARQNSVTMMQITAAQKQQQQQQSLQQPSKLNQKPYQQQTQPIQPPQPPVITSTSLKNILSQPVQQKENLVPSYQSLNQYNENSVESRESRDKVQGDEQVRGNVRDKDRGRGERDRYKSSRSRSRSRDRRRSRSRDRVGNRRRRDRSRTRSRDRRDRRRRSKSRDRSRNDNKSRREQRDPREQRDSREQREQNDKVESRDPRERMAKEIERQSEIKKDESESIPMDTEEDDEKNEKNLQQQNKPVSIWSVPPPLSTNQTNFMQSYSMYGQTQIPSYQTNVSQMAGFNQIGNQAQAPQQHQFQQTQNPFQQYQQMQTVQYPKTTQQQQQQYEQFQQQIQQSSQSNLHFSPDLNKKENNNTQKPDEEPLNFQSYLTSNLMSNFNYFGSNSKSTPFQNPYTMASKQTNQSSAPKEEIKAAEMNFSGIFGNNAKKEDRNQSRNSDDKPFTTQNASFDNKEEKISNVPSEDLKLNKEPDIVHPNEINYDEIKGNCIKVSNMCSSTSYSDLRRFFSGLYIANNGIKMINDKHGLRIGVAFVRFVRPESKPKAFIRNGLALKSKRVIIESCTEEEFDEVVDSFKPGRQISRFDHTDEKNSQIGSSKDEFIKSEKEEYQFTTLVLEQLPPFAKEQDIIKLFSSYTLFDIVLTKKEYDPKQIICYVKFHRSEDAKMALKEGFNSKRMIGHKQIFTSRCTDEEFEKAKERHNMDLEMREEEEEEADEDNMSNQQSAYDPFVKDSDDNTIEDTKLLVGKTFNREDNNSYDNLNERNVESDNKQPPQIPSLLNMPPITADPRRRGGRQGSRFNRPEDNQNKTTFILIKNCDYRSTKFDFVDFFADLGITPNRIEILFNHRNQPSGECIVEFNSAEDAEKSLLKNNRPCGNRNARIELIPPAIVAERLGEDFLQGSNNREDSYPSLPPFNADSNDDNGNFNTGLQEQLINMISSNFVNEDNDMDNISQEGSQNPFRQSNIGNNNMNNSQRPVRGLDDNRGNRRGQRKSRFSDFKDNKRFPPNSNANMSQNTPQNLPQTLNNASVDQFGQPGCVVGMENVPYKAGIEDILEFFHKFNVQPQNVIRRYNDDGSPTGDARVAFTSPMEARAALESKRHQKIFNRTIFLSLV